MTNQEFSDTFDTLINSYNTQASFGEGSSRADIVLDEYEKSVLLTQAQDSIIKQYFQGVSLGAGFDDSTRRQVDFSSLIKTALLNRVYNYGLLPFKIHNTTNEEVFTLKLMCKKFVDSISRIQLSIESINNNSYLGVELEDKLLNVAIYISPGDMFLIGAGGMSQCNKIISTLVNGFDPPIETPTENMQLSDIIDIECVSGNTVTGSPQYALDGGSIIIPAVDVEKIPFNSNGILFDMPKKVVNTSNGLKEVTDVLFILNEAMIVGNKNYVIVPINYKEYDREMSKAYAQPLKKQAWRLFQNPTTGFDVVTELIPKFGVVSEDSEVTYKIRYIRRPRPIVLEDLPNNLEIDGISSYTECELNPSLHYDILQAAVQMAINTRGRQPSNQQRRQREESNSE